MRKTRKIKPAQSETNLALANCLCPACVNNSGFTDDTKKIFCPICLGRGAFQRPEKETVKCPACAGTAKSEILDGPRKGQDGPCLSCSATGLVSALDAPVVEPPKAVEIVEVRLALAEARLLRVENFLSQQLNY